METEYDEDEVKLLLCGDGRQQEEGLKRLYERFKRPLWAWIRDKYDKYGLYLRDEHDVESIITDVMATVWQRFSDNEFDLNKRLDSFMFTVARNKAIDHLRKQGRHVKTVEQDISEIGHALAGTEINEFWRNIQEKDLAVEFRRRLEPLLFKMPPRQREVALVIADHFPEPIDNPGIVAEIYRRTNESLTVAAVRSAKRQVQEKFYPLLKEMGLGSY